MQQTTEQSRTDALPDCASGERDITLGRTRNPRRGSPMRRIAVAAASLAFMLGLVCVVSLVMLARGPIETAFLSERIAQGIEERIGAGIDVEVGRTIVETSEAGFGLHIVDIVLKDAKGREILRSPDAKVSFSPLRLLRYGIVPDRIALRGMAMKAEITPEGDIIFKTAGGAGPAGEPAGVVSTAQFGDVSAFFLSLGGPESAGGLSALSIENASLLIEDRRNGKQIAFQNMSLAFGSPREGALEAKGSLRKERDVVPFSMTSEPVAEGRRLRFAFAGVGDQLLQAVLGARTPYLHLGSKLEAGAEALVGLDGRLRDLALSAAMGAGSLTVPALHPESYPVDRFAVTARWRSEAPQEATLRAEFAGGGASLSIAGPVEVPALGWQSWRWRAAGERWTLPALAAGEAQPLAERVELDATLDPTARALAVHRLAAQGGGADIALSGRFWSEDAGPGLSLTLAAGRMALRQAIAWWPAFAAPHARDFLARGVRGGELQHLSLALDMPTAVLQQAARQEPLPRDAVRLEAAVENGVLSVAEGLPPIAGLSGQARLDALQLQGSASRGHLEPRPGRRVALSEGSFAFSRLDTWAPDAQFRFKVAGGLDAVAELLRAPALKDAHKVDVDPANVKGQFDGTVTIGLPLANEIKASQVATQVEGRMTGVTVEKAIGKDRLENATLTVATDKGAVEVKGEGRWQGTPVSLTLENDAAGESRTAVLSLTLDEAALKRRGINLDGRLSGPLGVRIRSLQNQRDSKAQIEIDLAKAAIDGLLPGLQKPAGRPGKLAFEAVERPNGYAIQNLALDTGPSSFRGQAEALADGTVTSARFSLFRLSPGDNVRLDYDRTAGGAKVTIRGNNLDARPFLRSAGQSEPARGEAARAEADRDLELDVRTTLLSGHNGEVITGADARLAMRGRLPRQLSVTGKLNGQPVSLSGRAAGEAILPVVVESDDAGALMRYFDLYTRMAGGGLSGQIMVSPRRMTGYFIAKDFALRNEPAIRRLVSEARSDDGRAEASETAFTKMRIDFTREGTETAIRDAVIFGPQLGLTFTGVVDQTRDRVSLSGTYVPAYGLNNAFAQIPIVGGILGGGRNEGLLALTFGVAGRASQPNVTVNPLSAVAPGIFRKIFEFRNDRTGAVPPPAVMPAPN